LLQRDHVGYRDILRKLSLDTAWQRELEDILRLRGGQEVCSQALELSANEGAQAAIKHLCEVWDVLAAYGVQEHVLIDLTMIGDFSYYTGMTFEGYASQLGFPVCSGGRYDNLLAQFGRPAHATGFAIKTTRIVEVVEDSVEEQRKVLIIYEAAQRRSALSAANHRRTHGEVVVTELLSAANEDELSAVRLSAAKGSFSYRGTEFNALVEVGKDEGELG
jgi:ATP phosphoribosyltransferase regulatory subunit